MIYSNKHALSHDLTRDKCYNRQMTGYDGLAKTAVVTLFSLTLHLLLPGQIHLCSLVAAFSVIPDNLRMSPSLSLSLSLPPSLVFAPDSSFLFVSVFLSLSFPLIQFDLSSFLRAVEKKALYAFILSYVAAYATLLSITFLEIDNNSAFYRTVFDLKSKSIISFNYICNEYNVKC